MPGPRAIQLYLYLPPPPPQAPTPRTRRRSELSCQSAGNWEHCSPGPSRARRGGEQRALASDSFTFYSADVPGAATFEHAWDRAPWSGRERDEVAWLFADVGLGREVGATPTAGRAKLEREREGETPGITPGLGFMKSLPASQAAAHTINQ